MKHLAQGLASSFPKSCPVHWSLFLSFSTDVHQLPMWMLNSFWVGGKTVNGVVGCARFRAEEPSCERPLDLPSLSVFLEMPQGFSSSVFHPLSLQEHTPTSQLPTTHFYIPQPGLLNPFFETPALLSSFSSPDELRSPKGVRGGKIPIYFPELQTWDLFIPGIESSDS